MTTAGDRITPAIPSKAELFTAERAVQLIKGARLWNSGGGCMLARLEVPGGAVLVSEEEEPGRGPCWLVGWYEGDEFESSDEGAYRTVYNDRELLAAVALAREALTA